MFIDNEFFIIMNAVAGGLGIAIISGLLGSFMLWRGMSYFGDALAHSSLLGVTIGVLYNLNITLSVFLVSIAFAVAFSQNLKRYTSDVMLGILSYSALSLAILIASYHKVRMNFMDYLFGDILAINFYDIIYLIICSLVIIIWFYYNWGSILLYSLNEELYQAEAGSPKKLKLGFTLVLALFVATAFKIVGVLLITAMLILPSASAVIISSKPEEMIKNAIIIGVINVMLGIAIAVTLDLPTGPSIIITALILFIVVNVKKTVDKFL